MDLAPQRWVTQLVPGVGVSKKLPRRALEPYEYVKCRSKYSKYAQLVHCMLVRVSHREVWPTWGDHTRIHLCLTPSTHTQLYIWIAPLSRSRAIAQRHESHSGAGALSPRATRIWQSGADLRTREGSLPHPLIPDKQQPRVNTLSLARRAYKRNKRPTKRNTCRGVHSHPPPPGLLLGRGRRSGRRWRRAGAQKAPIRPRCGRAAAEMQPRLDCSRLERRLSLRRSRASAVRTGTSTGTGGG